MEAFSQHIAAWQPFFITLATVCATLAGLLFVAISLHPANKDEAGKINLRRLAEHTFADFLLVLFIGLFFSVPGEPPQFYALSTLVIVAAAIREPAQRVLEAWRDRAHATHRMYFLRRVGPSLLGRVLLLIGSATLYLHRADGAEVEQDMLWFFSGSLVPLIAAMRNAWFLILQEAA
jgi:hypothetical protein